METRHQRASSDARAWKFTRREIGSALALGAATFVITSLLDGVSWRAVWASIGVVVLGTILLPFGVYAASWLTAMGRIHHDVLGTLISEIAKLQTDVLLSNKASVKPTYVQVVVPELSLDGHRDVVYVNVRNPSDHDLSFTGGILWLQGITDSFSFPLVVRWKNAVNTKLLIPGGESRQLEVVRLVPEESNPMILDLQLLRPSGSTYISPSSVQKPLVEMDLKVAAIQQADTVVGSALIRLRVQVAVRQNGLSLKTTVIPKSGETG